MSTLTDIIATDVARAVRERRERAGLSLRALAARSGVSASMISDIERCTKSPTIATLAAVAEALAVPVAGLIDGAAPPRIRVVRAAEQGTLVDPGSGARRESFGPALAGSSVEFLRYRVPPNALAGPFPAHASGTIEHVHLATGTVTVTVGGESVRLVEGDSCTCHADAPHAFDNRDGKVEALLYVVIEPS
jgi:transcriptional regulator with XRE-family HTH domain